MNLCHARLCASGKGDHLHIEVLAVVTSNFKDSFFLSNASLFVVFIGFSLERLSKKKPLKSMDLLKVLFKILLVIVVFILKGLLVLIVSFVRYVYFNTVCIQVFKTWCGNSLLYVIMMAYVIYHSDISLTLSNDRKFSCIYRVFSLLVLIRTPLVL